MSDRSLNDGNLHLWRWDARTGDFVRDAPDIPPEIAETIPELRAAVGLDHETVDRLIGPEKFADFLCRLSKWQAKKKGVPEIAIDPTDPAFVEASEVAYRRLMEGPFALLLPYISNAAFVDAAVVAGFVIPYFSTVNRAVAEKRKAQKALPKPAEAQEGAQQ